MMQLFHEIDDFGDFIVIILLSRETFISATSFIFRDTIKPVRYNFF